MADNYLERKMEELRNGRTGAVPTRQYAVKRKQLCYPFKTLRVLIVADSRKYIAEYARQFSSHEGRVAVFNGMTVAATDLGEDSGCRYYDVSGGNVAESFRDLIKAWRDVDVVVMLDTVPEVQKCLSEHCSKLPYPNDWGMPVLEVGENCLVRHTKPDFIPLERHSMDTPECAAAAILPYLSLPQNSCISSIQLQH